MGPLPVSGNKSRIGTLPRSFVYVLSMVAFTLTQQRPGVVTETIWPQSQEYYLFFFLTEHVCQPLLYILSVQFSSVTQSCPTLCNPINRSTPGLPVHHQLPEFTQTHVHRVSDAIQPSHPLSSPSPPAPNPSQHQGLFQ